MKEKSQLANTILVLIGLIIAATACILALFVVPEFRLAVGLDKPPSTATPDPPKVRCVGNNTFIEGESGIITGNAICEINLQKQETIAGTAEIFADELSNNHISCAIFAFRGPINIKGLKVTNTNWALYRNLDKQGVLTTLEAKETALRRQTGTCFQANGNYVVLPVEIKVPGDQENGVRYDVLLTGKYTVQIVGGAYSPFPTEEMADKEWRSIIYLYKNQEIVWVERPKVVSLDNPDLVYFEPSKVNAIGSIGEWETTTQKEAESLGKSQTALLLELKAGDFVIFAPIDDQGWYDYNRGEIFLEITLIGR